MLYEVITYRKFICCWGILFVKTWNGNFLAMKLANKQKALFLDRDGTINIEKEYVFKIRDFEFQPGIFNLIRKYQERNNFV